MDYPLRFPDQLRQQLRALREAKGLTQAQLGKLPGIGQVRVAEIERDPSVVSVAQLFKLLAAVVANAHGWSSPDLCGNLAADPATTLAVAVTPHRPVTRNHRSARLELLRESAAGQRHDPTATERASVPAVLKRSSC